VLRRRRPGEEQANDVATALIMHEWLFLHRQNSHSCMINKGDLEILLNFAVRCGSRAHDWGSRRYVRCSYC